VSFVYFVVSLHVAQSPACNATQSTEQKPTNATRPAFTHVVSSPILGVFSHQRAVEKNFPGMPTFVRVSQ